MQFRQSFKFTEAQSVEVEVSVLAEDVWSVVNQWAPTASMFRCSFDWTDCISSSHPINYVCTGKVRGQKAVEWLMITPCPYTSQMFCCTSLPFCTHFKMRANLPFWESPSLSMHSFVVLASWHYTHRPLRCLHCQRDILYTRGHKHPLEVGTVPQRNHTCMCMK